MIGNVNYHRAIVLISALQFLAAGNRTSYEGWGMRRALLMASNYTGKPYTRTRIQRAIDDLTAWVQANGEST